MSAHTLAWYVTRFVPAQIDFYKSSGNEALRRIRQQALERRGLRAMSKPSLGISTPQREPSVDLLTRGHQECIERINHPRWTNRSALAPMEKRYPQGIRKYSGLIVGEPPIPHKEVRERPSPTRKPGPMTGSHQGILKVLVIPKLRHQKIRYRLNSGNRNGDPAT